MDEETKSGNVKTEDDEKFTMIDQIAVAVSAPGSYNKLTNLSTGRTVVYFVLLLILLAFMKMGISTIVYISDVGGFENLFLNTLPEFSVEGGKLVMDDKIELNIGADVLVYVDTDISEISVEDLPETDKVCVAFGQNNILMAINSNVLSQEYLNEPVKDMLPDGLNNQVMSDMVPVIYFCIVLVFIFTMAGQAVSLCFIALIIFIAARVVSAKLETNLSSGKVYLICMYSMSLPMILMRANEAAGYLLPSSIVYLVGVCIALAFVTRGILSHSDKKFDINV